MRNGATNQSSSNVPGVLLHMKIFLNIQVSSFLSDNESLLDANSLLDIVQEVLRLLCTNNLQVL